MASTAEVRLLLNAVDKSSNVISGVTGKMSGLEKATQAAGDFAGGLGIQFGTLTNPAMLAGQAVRFLGEQAWELGKQGGVFQQTSDSFAMLLDKVDAAPNLLDQLRAASLGTVDDMTLMSATSTLLAGTQGDLATNLANATPRLLEIAKAAQKLNPSLGDTAFLYESIATGIKRASPMILDNLGITVKVGKANEEYAAILGKTVDALTADEKAQALLNATMEAGDVIIQQAGGNIESATDEIQRMDAEWKNLKNTAGVLVAPAVADVAGATNDYLGMQVALIKAMKEGNITMGEANALVREATFGTKTFADVTEELTNSMAPVETSLRGINDASYETVSAFEELNPEVTVGYEAMRNMALATDASSVAFVTYDGQVNSLSEAMAKFSAELVYNKAAQDMDMESAIALGVQMGVVDEKTVYLTERLASLRDEFDTNRNGMIDASEAASGYSQRVIDLYNSLARLDGKTATTYVNTIFSESTNRIDDRVGGEQLDYARGGSGMVPAGSPNDGARLNVSSGEAWQVTPAGNAGNVTNNNYFNLTMQSNAPVSTLARDFDIMRSMKQ